MATRKRTSDRTIQTPVERIKFAIRFAGMDLNSLRPGDWLNLKDDFCQFFGTVQHTMSSLPVGPGEVLVTPKKAPFPWEYKEADFRKLQQELKQVLQGGSVQIFKEINLSDLSLSQIRFKDETTCLSLSGSTRDAFLLLLVLLLFKEGGANISQCPECASTFWRETLRQKFCSRRCANLHSVKAFNARKNEKKKAAKQTGRKFRKETRR